MPISPARRAAFDILRRVDEEAAFSSVLLARTDDYVSAKDRGLCHELVLGVLRRLLWLDRSIEYFASRKIESLDLSVIIALRLGLYQLRFLSRIPAPAAINESVNLVKAARVKSAASFVNAVLRRATREPNHEPTTGIDDPVEKLSIETSHPRWLIERWKDQFGFEESAAIARSNNQPATTALRLTAKAIGDRERIIAELKSAGLVESTVAPGAWRVSGDDEREEVGRDAGVPQARMPALQLLRTLANEGVIYFQDEASQLVAHLVGATECERVLDVCAAPGSKSTLVAALARQSRIVSCDLYEHRMRTMKNLAAQQEANNIEFVVHDAMQSLPFRQGSFDRVLVDAPCTGTGTLRHNPEIRWRLKASNIAELAEKQKRILDNASKMVRDGGLLLYSTCSLETDENESITNEFLAEHPDFEVARLQSETRSSDENGAVRTWPHRDDTDGFFAIGFRRLTD
jgi:16S rRNA (cytosine967-C5)-methyltransferase